MAHACQEIVFRLVGTLELDILLAKRLFKALSVRNVPNRAAHQHTVVGFERAKADFNGKLPAALVQAIKIVAGAHGTDARLGGVRGAVLRMPLAKARGYQKVDAFPQQFVALVTEKSLGLRIHQDDFTAL